MQKLLPYLWSFSSGSLEMPKKIISWCLHASHLIAFIKVHVYLSKIDSVIQVSFVGILSDLFKAVELAVCKNISSFDKNEGYMQTNWA